MFEKPAEEPALGIDQSKLGVLMAESRVSWIESHYHFAELGVRWVAWLWNVVDLTVVHDPKVVNDSFAEIVCHLVIMLFENTV